MRGAALLVLIGFACLGCAEYPPAVAAAPAVVAPAPAPATENSRVLTDKVRIGGQPQASYGTACLQPDGTWRIVAPASSAPQTVYQTTVAQVPYVYPTPYAYPAPYPYYSPFYNPFWPRVSLGASFIFDGHHHHGGHHHHH
jgi:hypothetical protein